MTGVSAEYWRQRGKKPFAWQELVVQFLAFVGIRLGKNTVVDIPTGFGKSLILALLSKLIIDQDPECTVVVVTLNEYLLMTALQEYSWL